ncbi:hypothetical protein ACFXHA_02170 [Nocardia sp. NPDC059240]|uniref:hypothetical protein n=1 Tax=Nocardia sp. NPDC059240 TaxID=3346786 RepID=UPI003698A82E
MGGANFSRKWAWIAGAGVVVVAIAVAVAVTVHSKSSDSKAVGPTYPNPSDECALISTATLNQLAPGAVCKRSPGTPLNPDEIVRTPSWTVESFTRPTSIQLTLQLVSKSGALYDRTKSSLTSTYESQLTNPTSTAIAGTDLGPQVQAGFMISGASKSITGRSDAHLLLWSGNAVVTLSFNDFTDPVAIAAAAKTIATDIAVNLKSS